MKKHKKYFDLNIKYNVSINVIWGMFEVSEKPDGSCHFFKFHSSIFDKLTSTSHLKKFAISRNRIRTFPSYEGIYKIIYSVQVFDFTF